MDKFGGPGGLPKARLSERQNLACRIELAGGVPCVTRRFGGSGMVSLPADGHLIYKISRAWKKVNTPEGYIS
jgi:hypothetical protein